VSRRVDVLVAVGGGIAARAAKAATSTIPIVFATGLDPVEDGLVKSFNRPGGNAIGYAIWTNYIESKRLGLLHELAPNVAANLGSDVQLFECCVDQRDCRIAVDVPMRDEQGAGPGIEECARQSG